MECARRGIHELRRRFWYKGALVEATKETIIPDDELTRTLRTYDSGTWKASVIQITRESCNLVEDPHPYAFLLNSMRGNGEWFLCAEVNADGIFHVHALVRNPQRSDAWVRSANTTWFNTRVAALESFDAPDPLLSIIKCQNAHKPSSLLCYMVKSPLWLAASDEHNLAILSTMHEKDMGDRFRERQQSARNFGLDANAMTKDLLEIITEYNCKTMDDIFRAAPERIVNYLHRPGLCSIVQNCLTWATATQGGWTLERIAAKHSPDPSKIHTVLLHQGIQPSTFDPDFFAWVSKKSEKRNTFVLYGPSNTGKSGFIKGFKEAVSWGEIVNGGQFSFEGLIGNMFGVWEEPLISAEQAEKCKQLFEGMTTSIPVKYKKPQRIDRIPIIMTTNHYPWRYCTAEEPTFRNRMYMYNWDYDATDGFVCRASEHSCECCVCQASRSGSAGTSRESVSRMSGEERSIQEFMDAGHGERASPVGSPGSVRSGSKRVRRGSEGDDNGGYSSSAGECSEQCSDRAGPSSSASSAASNGLRSGGNRGSSNSRKRVRCSEPEHAESVVTIISGGSDGGNLEPDGVGEDGSGDAASSNDDFGRSRDELAAGEALVVLGCGAEISQDTVQSTNTGLGGEMATLTIPSRSDWLCYLSYLQNKHGN